MNLERLQRFNPDLTILSVNSAVFNEYGQVLSNIDPTEMLAKLNQHLIPKSGSTSVIADADLLDTQMAEQLRLTVFGGQQIQIGYYNGHNDHLDALEWHHAPEVMVATANVCLFLGQRAKLTRNGYAVGALRTFFVPAGTVIALYGTTMHYAPLQTSEDGYRCMVALPANTKTDLPAKMGNVDPLLHKRGQWLIAHPDNHALIEQGVVAGIMGKNLALNCQIPATSWVVVWSLSELT